MNTESPGQDQRGADKKQFSSANKNSSPVQIKTVLQCK